MSARLRDRHLSPISAWLLGFAAGFASSLYVGVYVVSWVTAVALLVVTPVFVPSRRIAVGFSGFALGMAAMLIWYVTRGGCGSPGGCPEYVAMETYAGVLMAGIGIALLLWTAFWARDHSA